MIVYLLNLFDAACTLVALRRGVRELNPLMQMFLPRINAGGIQINGLRPIMAFDKVVIVGGLLWWLSRRPERVARCGLRCCTAAYAVLALHHIAGLIMICRR